MLGVLSKGGRLGIATRNDQDRQQISFYGYGTGSETPDFSSIVNPLMGFGGDPGLQLCRKILIDHGAEVEMGAETADFLVWFPKAIKSKPEYE